MAVALIVVGPEKLPEIAKSMAKGVIELKKAAYSLKDSLQAEDSEPWEEVKPGTDDKLFDAYNDLPAAALPEPPAEAGEQTGDDGAAAVQSQQADAAPAADSAADPDPGLDSPRENGFRNA